MSTYQTDEEQVEAIKKWWKENGKSVIGGVALGFAVIGGWQGWQTWQRNQGEAASILYDTMRQAEQASDLDRATSDGKRLVGEYGNSAYASFAALQMAKLAYERGEKAAARGHLQWVVDAAPDRALRELARLRLGYLLLDMQDLDALQALLKEAPADAFAAEFAALRGDLAVAQGNAEAARSAYSDALARGVADKAMVEMKLVEVGGQQPAS